MAQLDRRRRYGKMINGTTEEPGHLKFTAQGDCVFTLRIGSGVKTSTLQSVSYSIDNGVTWVTTNNVDDTEVVITTPTITEGNSVLWKGSGLSMAKTTGLANASYFSSTGMFAASGNVMSLLYGDDFEGELMAKNYAFSSLFYNCTSLTSAPELPATTLGNYCYQSMFSNCKSLTVAPELPATTLGNCCYQSMFSNCKSLTVAPALPATSLLQSCYSNMFAACTSLASAPELPATTLAYYCYNSMFAGCTSLASAPELPATTLVNGCYNNMFSSCSSLRYVKALFTTVPGTSYTNNWMNGVASSGTRKFVRSTSATWQNSITRSASTVPSGWTIATS